MSYFVIGGDQNRYGPEELPTLIQWAREGRLIASTVLIDEQSGQQILASQIPALAPHLLRPAAQHVTAQPVNVGIPPPVYMNVAPVGPKSKVAAGLLGIIFGGLGLHRFYLGYTGVGIIQLLLFLFGFQFCLGVPIAIWGLIEGIVILCGGMRNAEGRLLRD